MRDRENTVRFWPRPHLIQAPAPHKLRETLGERLRAARQSTTMSLQTAAREGRFARNSLELWESGEILPDLHTLIRLACCYGASVDWLLGITVE